MGSFSNFRNFNDLPLPEGSGEKTTMDDVQLIRQSSIYSLTFDEFQNTLGGLGKDYGSMNMDELLRNIWTAEETQGFASSGVSRGCGNAPSVVPLQKQGSLTLPRTLSQKTVDDVWKDLFKESTDFGSSSGVMGSKLEQRQATLGEMTLEEFLMKAGVVRDNNNNNNVQVMGNNNNAFYAGLSQPTNSNAGLSLNFQLPNQNNSALHEQINENVNSTTNRSSILPFSIDANTRQTPQQLLPPKPIFPKQTTTMTFTNQELRSGPAVVGRINNSSLIQGATVQGGPIIRVNPVVDSPVNQLSPDVKSGLDTPSYSPPSFTFNGGAKGRKCGASMEKAMERRHKRMIKNRESAARSRERKQAYTLELEAEIVKLKEINQQLQKEQEEIIEAQKNKILEAVKTPWTSKRVCLRRTLTGPW